MKPTRLQTKSAVESILSLRRLERDAEPDARRQLSDVRALLEELVGPTITRAEAARLLGISQTGLDRWIDRGEIAAVITPSGRREIPLTEVVELLEELDERGERGARPLTPVMRSRHERATKAIDIERLLPRRKVRSHRTAELHALAYHRLVAERLDEHMVDDARRRLNRWVDEGRLHPDWAEQWTEILAMPLERIARSISADTTRARELRQTSPFAGALTEQERRLLLRAVEERARA